MAVSPGINPLMRQGDGGSDPIFVSLENEGPVPQILNGAVFEQLDVPTTVAAGQSIDVTGVMGFDCPHCAADRPIRVRAETSEGDTRIQEVGELSGRGETSPFSISLPAPQTTGTSVTVTVQAQRLPPDPIYGWQTDNEETATVNVVTQGEKQREQVTNFAPWAVGGGAVGAGAAQLTNRSLVGGGVAGVGGGVAAKMLMEQTGGLPDFPTTEVLALSALGVAGFLVLNSLPDVDLPSPSRRDIPSLPAPNGA